MESMTERCPWCGTLISRVKFHEIEERIRQEEQKKRQDFEVATRKRLEGKFQSDVENERKKILELEAGARRLLEEKFQQDLAREKQAAEKRAGEIGQTLKAERDRTAEKIKALEGREVSLRKQLTDEAATAAKRQLDEQRSILERDRDQSLNRVRAEFTREREATQKKVADLERQLQKKTAYELGDGAEIDLFEALREAFPGDRIKRVPKGETGADIHHVVLYKGESCGQIVLDSKNRKAWQNAFAAKLHEDKVAAKADHAILASNVFPAGQKELCFSEGVIVVSPARVVFVVELLRSSMIRMHVQGLSMQERKDKVGLLYEYIASDRYGQRVKEAARIADQILELDVQELKDHEKVWKSRGGMARRLKGIIREIEIEVGAIVEGEGHRPAKTA